MANRLLLERWKHYWATSTPQERMLFASIVAYLFLWLCGGIFTAFGLYAGVGLAISVAFKLTYPVAIFYGVTRREIWGYGGTLLFLTIDLVGRIGLIIWSVLEIGTYATFMHPIRALDTWLDVALIISILPCLFFTYKLFKPLYSERKKLRKMAQEGLQLFYTNTARQVYRHWMAREELKQNETMTLLASIYSEFKRRDARMSGLKPLLSAPDDWVRITAARQLLRKDDNTALNTLDAIAAQNSEWSDYAREKATKWREGKLLPWN